MSSDLHAWQAGSVLSGCAVATRSGAIREAPWSAGLRAARANLLPALLLQAVMVGMLVAYFLHPGTREVLGEWAACKERWGYFYSAVAGALAGGVLPELLRWLLLQARRWHASNTSNLVVGIFFWSSIGVLVDAFYRVQAWWWGDEATLAAVLPQVLVDQFIFTPLLTAPLTCLIYDWKNHRWRWQRRFLTFGYYRDSIFPTLVAIWGVWIPVVSILYTLPEEVQIPLYSLALTLWVVLYTWISEERAKRED